MSSRFHNKYHRHNHHTTPISDPRYPDAAHDPIASHDSPFLGDFVLLGTLSATALQATGTLSADNISFTGNVISTYSSPLISTGEFLQIVVNGVSRYIRLWNLS